jgi:hypothetical protein
MKSITHVLAIGVLFGLSSVSPADDLKVEQRFTDTTVGFSLPSSNGNVTLTISGPEGYQASAQSSRGAPTIDLRQQGTPPDGLYKYQLAAATGEKTKVRTPHDNGREGGPKGEQGKGATASGVFRVKDGKIVKPDSAPEPRLTEDTKRNRQDR